MSTARLRLPAVWLRWVPGVAMLRTYQRGWLPRDLLAGVVLTAVLVPIGMSYAQASGLPVIAGLYATIAALVGYAIFGPSRILVLGPDSALAALIAGAIVPLAHGDAGRALALAALLAIMSGALCTLAGVLKLGFVTDLLSRPIQYGYLNGIAVTLAVGQVPGLLGFSASGATFADAASNIVRGVLAGRVDSTSFTLGAGCIACLMLMRRYAPRWPGVLVAVIATTLAGRWLQHAPGARVAVVGMLPGGAPWPRIPRVPLADIGRLAPGAIAIALVSVADISVLSRAFSASNGDDTDRNQELVALGIANLLAGLLRGCAVSSSSSRTPVALAAGARTQLTNLAAAACIALLLVLPAMLSHVPSAALAAVVIFSAAGIIDVRSMARLFRMRRGEFAISLFCFAGVVLLGVVPGILLAVVRSLLSFVWRAWHPYDAVLGRIAGMRGYHDISRHPGARQSPGVLVFRWDAPLFYANAGIFCDHVRTAIARAEAPVECVTIAAEPITDIDVTAADTLVALRHELRVRRIALQIAEMKGPVKDRLRAYGLYEIFGAASFFPTVTDAVDHYARQRRPPVP